MNVTTKVPLVLRIGVVGHIPGQYRLRPSAGTLSRPEPDEARIKRQLREVLGTVAKAFKRVEDEVYATESDARLFEPWKGDDSRSELRLISSLAAGPDTWAAVAAKNAIDGDPASYSLQVILPFTDDGDEDLGERAATEGFQAPSAVLRLDGYRRAGKSIGDGDPRDRYSDEELGQRGRSYQAAANLLLSQTDILLAVWDGEFNRSKGGTGESVQQALELGIPVIHLEWKCGLSENDARPCLRIRERGKGPNDHCEVLNEEVLRGLIRDLLLPLSARKSPGAADEDADQVRKEAKELVTYFEESEDSKSPWTRWLLVVWPWFKTFFGSKAPKANSSRDNQASHGDHHGHDSLVSFAWILDWGRSLFALIGGSESTGVQSSQLPPAQVDAQKRNSKLLERHALLEQEADELSNYYGGLYRGGYLMNFILGAFAVCCAIGTFAAEYKKSYLMEQILTSLELVSIIAILAITQMGKARQWHRRWIDYRTLAEFLRQARFNLILGSAAQRPSIPGHLAEYGSPDDHWTAWRQRSIERALGLMTLRFDAEYLRTSRDRIAKALLLNQSQYHEATSDRLERVDHRLHKLGDSLFVLTLLACLAHVFCFICFEKTYERAWMLTVLCGALPVIGGSLAAIRSQGEFTRVKLRSRAMAKRLSETEIHMGEILPEGNDNASIEMRRLHQEAATLMTKEVLDWNIVFQDRPLALPA